MQKQRSIATATNSLIRFPWRPTNPLASKSIPPRSNNSQASILDKYLLNPVKQYASKMAAETIANNAFGQDYLAHDFVLGVEAAFPKFCAEITNASRTGEVDVLKGMMTGPLANKFLHSMENMASAKETMSVSGNVRRIAVKNIWIRYGHALPSSTVSIVLKDVFADGSTLSVIKTGNSVLKEGDFIYRWNNLEWVMSRQMVLAHDFEITEELFSAESAKSMNEGLTIGVETVINADMEFQYHGRKVLVEEKCRTDVSIMFETGVIHLKDLDSQKAIGNAYWKVSNVDGCM
ncbi:hypothetical protein HDU79_007995 [Rhizoclosmatium sp. JEL0117]|nr:hypothetical protein HDU79_007995 [Rhizoclosmatium sp. JEL0117]